MTTPVEDLHLVDPPRRLAHHLLRRIVDPAGASDTARSDGKESLVADPARLPAAGRR